jgi:hypothetical protein
MIQAYGQALAPAAAGVGYGVVSGETPSDQAQTALALGALGLMAPRGAARLYQSPAIQQYLMRGIQSPLIRGTMLSPVTRGISTYAPAAGLLSSQD